MRVARFPAASAAETPFPGRLVRDLLGERSVRMGFTVLLVGGEPAGLPESLRQLSWQVDVLETTPAAAQRLNTDAPHLGCRYLPPAWWAQLPTHHYDLVLVRDPACFEGNLLELARRTRTAELLAAVRPGGGLALLIPPADAEGHSHDGACFTRHLGCFPGTLETIEYGRLPWWQAAWHKASGRPLPTPASLVRLQTPAQPIGRTEWLRLARVGVLTGRSACCTHDAAALPLRRAA